MSSSDYIKFQVFLSNVKTMCNGIILSIKVVFMLFFIPSIVLFLLLALNFMLDR